MLAGRHDAVETAQRLVQAFGVEALVVALNRCGVSPPASNCSSAANAPPVTLGTCSQLTWFAGTRQASGADRRARCPADQAVDVDLV